VNEPKHQILAQEITRKQFLQLSAGAIIAILGFGNLLSLLGGNKHTTLPSHHGFGSRKFGI